MEWRKYLVILLIVTVVGCNNKNNEGKKKSAIAEEVNKEYNDNVKQSRNEEMDRYEQILKNYGFKFPSDELYNKKLKEVFGLDLKDYAGKDFVEIKVELEVFEESNSFPEAIVYKKFIFWYPEANNDGWDDLAFVNLNKYIFYNDKAAFVYLKAKDNNAYLSRLVQYFGYDKDNELIDYLLKDNNDLSTSFSYNLFFGRNGFKGKMELRKELFEKNFKANPEADIYQSKFIDFILRSKKYQGNKEADIAYLLDKTVVQCYATNSAGLFCGAIDSFLDNNREFREIFRKNKFYGYEKIREYIQYTYEVDYLNQKRKIIKDPDGFTNLRAEKSSNSKVIEKIKTGSYVEIIDDTGDWWFVEYIEDKKVVEYKQGYVHKSRIISQ